MNRRSESKARTRAAAIVAAKRLWAKPGSYDNVGIREIASAMNMSVGAVFSNFESKAELWRAAFDSPPPVDSPATREGFNALQLLQRIAEVDDRDLIFVATGHQDLALQIRYVLGRAEMAEQMQAAA